MVSLYRLMKNILDRGYPASSKKYSRSHRKASEIEKLKFGKGKFKSLSSIISKNIPKGQLAGSHTKRGNIKINSRIPPKFRSEVKFHERIESRLMNGDKIKDIRGTGKNLKIT